MRPQFSDRQVVPSQSSPGTALRAAIVGTLLLAITACSDSSDSTLANTAATAATPDVKVASLNVLHGLFCAPETEDCRLSDRQDLLFDWLEAIGCPDVVLLQEILGDRIITQLNERAAMRCGGAYQVLSPALTLGQNYTLTRLPVMQTGEDELVGGIRNLFHVQLDHPTGVIDVFNTHFAAGIDLRPCDETCPPECQSMGAADSRECQAIQVARFVQERAAPDSLRILGGDFNADPETFEYRHMVKENGWIDAYLAAGNPECEPASGIGCTSGRESEALNDMESPANGVSRRIDFLFLQLPPEGSGAMCRYSLDSHGDDDGDGFSTRIFTDDPNPFVDRCGPLPEAICWPSDHEGMQADINCG